MLRTEAEVRRSIECVKAAFPRIAEWEHINEKNESYPGFSLWGTFVLEPRRRMARCFFITFGASHVNWRGYLTVGKHGYYWWSTSDGDAYLLDAGPCPTVSGPSFALFGITGKFGEDGGIPNTGEIVAKRLQPVDADAPVSSQFFP